MGPDGWRGVDFLIDDLSVDLAFQVLVPEWLWTVVLVVRPAAPFLLLERLAIGDLFGEMSGEAWGLVGVSFPMDIVLSAESGVVGLGEVDISWPSVLAFLGGLSWGEGENLSLFLLPLLLVMGGPGPLGGSGLGGGDHWAEGGVE